LRRANFCRQDFGELIIGTEKIPLSLISTFEKFVRRTEAPTQYRSQSYWSTRQIKSGLEQSIPNGERLKTLREWGDYSLAYSVATQPRLEYFGDARGFLAYGSRFGYTFVLGDPLCAESDKPELLREFLARFRSPAFVQVGESTARVLQDLGFKVNEIGVDTRLDLGSYSFAGKDKEWIRYAANWVARRGYCIEEGLISSREAEIEQISEQWRKTRTISRKEVRFLNRPMPMIDEEDVRRFFYISPEGKVEAFVFFDPLFEAGKLIGYVTCIKRRTPECSAYAETAIMKRAIEVFQGEGVPALWLGLSPLAQIDDHQFRFSRGLNLAGRYLHYSRWFNRLCYNFRGHTQYKRRFRGEEVKMYYASRSLNNSTRLLALCSLCGAF
jgi:lysylphosphatidylglycerol synthetase-like protein (DUF2156 family)